MVLRRVRELKKYHGALMTKILGHDNLSFFPLFSSISFLFVCVDNERFQIRIWFKRFVRCFMTVKTCLVAWHPYYMVRPDITHTCPVPVHIVHIVRGHCLLTAEVETSGADKAAGDEGKSPLRTTERPCANASLIGPSLKTRIVPATW